MTREEAIKYAEAMKAKIQEKLGRFGNTHGPAVYYSDLAFLSAAISALQEQEEWRWILVTESPKGKGCYIVAVNHWVDGKPVTREAYWNGCDWLSCDKKRELTPRVTHWMKLPEPPKGE